MNGGILMKLIHRCTRQWWHWEGQKFRGQGQSQTATEIL